MKTRIRYPEDYAASGFVKTLQDNNMVNATIGRFSYITKNGTNEYMTGGSVTEFASIANGDIKPINIYSLRADKPVEGNLGALGSNNGILGDFKDGNAGEDYTYDPSGNLVKDLNKNIQENGAGGVVYNYLNKPVKITLQNKSTIEYTYDAFGEKLTKKVTHTLTGQATTTEYLGDFVYEQGEGQPISLQYILHEEGRVKVITPVNTNDRYLEAGPGGIVLPNGKKGAFEFFVKDHLGSTRMVLTEEEQKEFYRATMESSVATTEEQLFGKVEGNGTVSGDNELRKTRYTQQPGVPSPWRDNNTDFVKLTAAEAGKQIGPNMLLKVMAGDKITTSADYYYYNNNSFGGTADPVSSVVASLINALVSPAKGSDPGKAFSGAINTSLNGSDALEQFVSVRQPAQGNTAAPKAFINVVYLDEQFRFLAPDDATPDVGTYTDRVSKADDPLAAFLPRTQKAPKNGWVFVYLSNESNESVYFDNLKVTHERGRLAQESHYYPNGLKIAGISSQAAGKLDTRYGYQGEFSEAESETGWDEFYLRSYDPQIGRWTGADPYDQFASPYVGMGNDPVNYLDPNGGYVGSFWYHAFSTVGASMIGGIIGAASAPEGQKLEGGLRGAAIGGGAGLAGSFVNWDVVAGAIGNTGQWVGSVFRGSDWRPFYKADLIKYANTRNENLLGIVFEEIFETYMRSTFPDETLAARFRRNDRIWTESGGRNSKPDFTSDGGYSTFKWLVPDKYYPVEEASAYEVKQNGGKGIYLSSNNNQIKGHISNLAAKHSFAISNGFRPDFTLITTYDVKFSPNIAKFAGDRKIAFTHRRAMYKIVNGQYQFKFVGFGVSRFLVDWLN